MDLENDHFIYKTASKKEKNKTEEWSRYTPRRLYFWDEYKSASHSTTSLFKKKRKPAGLRTTSPIMSSSSLTTWPYFTKKKIQRTHFYKLQFKWTPKYKNARDPCMHGSCFSFFFLYIFKINIIIIIIIIIIIFKWKMYLNNYNYWFNYIK